MRKDWQGLEDAAEKGPLSLFSWIFGFLVIVVILVGGVGYVFGWFGEAAQVAQQEFGPRAGLEKYEWFKSAAQQLGAKKQDIQNYQAAVADVEKAWANVAVTEWPRDVRQDLNQRKAEVTGLITAYNSLVAEYMAASKKFNWAPFEGKTDRPPLEFQEYKQL